MATNDDQKPFNYASLPPELLQVRIDSASAGLVPCRIACCLALEANHVCNIAWSKFCTGLLQLCTMSLEGWPKSRSRKRWVGCDACSVIALTSYHMLVL